MLEDEYADVESPVPPTSPVGLSEMSPDWAPPSSPVPGQFVSAADTEQLL